MAWQHYPVSPLGEPELITLPSLTWKEKKKTNKLHVLNFLNYETMVRVWAVIYFLSITILLFEPNRICIAFHISLDWLVKIFWYYLIF